jgi:hypothetical protein
MHNSMHNEQGTIVYNPRIMMPRKSFRSLSRSLGLSVLAGLLVAFSSDVFAQNVVVTPDKEGKSARVEISQAARDARGIVELTGRDGTVISTIYAGPIAQMQPTTVSYEGLKPGIYVVRYRENPELKFVSSLRRPDHPDGKWINPLDVVVAPMHVYVYDVADKSETADNSKAHYAIFKLNRDLSADLAFGKEGVLNVGSRASASGPVVDSAGTLYIGGASHHVSVFDWKGAPQELRLGSTEKNLKSPGSTTWIHAVTLGDNNRIYIGSKSGIKAYDRTKPGISGFLYGATPGFNPASGRSMTASGNALYVIDQRGQLHKYIDDGKSLKAAYSTAHKTADLVCQPMGMAVSGNLIWVCSRGPGPGPFWDSGGGGELLLYWDDGKSLKIVQRFGSLGVSPDRPQFVNPVSAAVTPDGTKLYVAEDGRLDARGPQDMPRGNARVRLFDISPKSTAETVLNIR